MSSARSPDPNDPARQAIDAVPGIPRDREGPVFRAPDLVGETYYRHWLNALERLVASKGVSDAPTLARYRDAWDHAAGRTPHGAPIELRAEDFRQEP